MFRTVSHCCVPHYADKDTVVSLQSAKVFKHCPSQGVTSSVHCPEFHIHFGAEFDIFFCGSLQERGIVSILFLAQV